MGNEKSVPSGLKTEEIIKITDDWIQKSATLSNDSTRVCIFEQLLKEDNIHTLQKMSKNLMVYRHPFILKYISSWRTNKTLHVTTEYGKPLALVIHDLMPMQLCVGLYNILKAVLFLQDMALSSHNNICKEAVYVTSEGYWKLGRLELLTRNKVCEHYSGKLKSNITGCNCELADHRGFANLAIEVLQKETDDKIPAVTEFRELCKLHSSSTNSDPMFLRQLFSHPFFSHEFVNIYNFLTELPAKSEEEKTDFFETLADKLVSFEEELVARQLGTLLLSRLVLLNSTAQKLFLPRFFSAKEDDETSLFSKVVLEKYISPKLLSMFSLRDSQIRLILLNYFASYRCIFSTEQLQNVILPELLVGIKDTNEILVATTLHTLADLVPLLGASVVIGKGRAKLFADGRPLLKTEADNLPEKFIESKLASTKETSPLNTFTLAERLSPDGGEDCTELSSVPSEKEMVVTNNVECSITDSLATKNKKLILNKIEPEILTNPVEVLSVNTKVPIRKAVHSSRIKLDEDLSSLDIKCSRSKTDTKFDDIELIFKDMEPVISRTAIMKIPSDTDVNSNNKFKAADINYENLDGWGDAITDWDSSENDI